LANACQQRQSVQLDFDVRTGQAGQLQILDSLSEQSSQYSEDNHSFCFRSPPPPHLILIGAVHITQHLAPMAEQCGFQISIIDPRGIFAHTQRFSKAVSLYDDWPSERLPSLQIDQACAMVTLTHDPKIDDDALGYALSSNCFYFACLGSRRTHAKRLERLAAQGISNAQLEKIKGPAGLDIGAKSPAEIAVSILAELIAAWRAFLNNQAA